MNELDPFIYLLSSIEKGFMFVFAVDSSKTRLEIEWD